MPRATPSAPPLPVVVAATFTADPVEEVLRLWAHELGQPFDVRMAPYNQVFQVLLDPGSGLSRNAGGLNLIALRLADWGLVPGRPLGQAELDAGRKAEEFAGALAAAAPRLKSRTVVCVCPASRSLVTSADGAAAAARIEASLAARLRTLAGVQLVLPDELAALYPFALPEYEAGPVHGHVPYPPAFFAALGTLAVRALRAATARPTKVLVLDCDQTLWKGVVGEDSPSGVVVDAPRRALQELALRQRAAGMLLCLCSKNVEDDVFAVLDGHPDMVLRREHLAAWRINWEPKSENLRALARQLNVGADSLVLLEDNPLECAEVRAGCPEATAIELPADPGTWPDFLRHLWVLDWWGATAEDAKRASFYQENAARDDLLQRSGSYAEFLASLELDVRIFTPEPRQVPRVAQLTQRTNQFNTTTLRRQEPEIAALVDALRGGCVAVEVRDRFGDYGLVGVALLGQEGNALVVEGLLLSCRALGRGVEHRMVARLGEIALERGLAEVRLPFVPTAKNQPARQFLDGLAPPRTGAAGDSRSVYVLPASEAAAVRLDPTRAAERIPAEGETAPAPSGASAPQTFPFALDGATFARAARDLRTPEAIEALLQAARRHPRPPQATPYVAPRNGIEATLARLWSESLALDRVGIDDDFFALGGTSLQAAALVNSMQEALARPFSSVIVYDAPTVAATAALLVAAPAIAGPGVRRSEALAAPDGGRTGPLSFSQQRLWFLDQFTPGSVVYNEWRAIRLQGALDVPALRGALEDLIGRHESLRTRFPALDGRAVQRVDPPAPLPLSVIDLAGSSAGAPLDEARNRVAAELARPFALGTGPLFRAGVLGLGPQDHALWLVFHHVIADGSSVAILLRELAAFYRARLAGADAGLPALPVQYLDFSTWQRETQAVPAAADLAYWHTQLGGNLPALELPSDRPRPPVLSYRGARLPIAIEADIVAGLREIGRRESATLFMTLMATFQILLYRQSGQEDVVVGFPIAGRTRREIEGVVGFFVNSLPLRVDLSGNPPFAEAVRRVRRRALEVYAHQEVPFEKLVEELVPVRDLSRTPIFQVMLALLEDPVAGLDLPGIMREPLEVPVTTTRFDLLLNLEEGPDGLRGGLEYSTDLFDRATIERFASHLDVLLRAAVADPGRPILALPLLRDEERQQLLAPARAHFPGEACLHRRFEEQVRRSPEAVALVCEGTELSYQELNGRANQLAHHLLSLGVRPDELVGLCTDRSVDLVVGILGILKAGGAYLPLDPSYPPDRLRFLLEDARVRTLVTEERHLAVLGTAQGAAAGPNLVCLDRDRVELDARPDSDPESEVAPDHLAYVIYTSGSTGKPKGVLVTHRNVARLFEATDAWFRFDASDAWTLFHSFAFDFSVWELWGALLYGGRLVVVPYWVSRSPEAFHELLRRERITVLNQTPSAFRQLAQADLARGGPSGELALRYVIFGGEALELQTLRPWFRRHGDARPRLVNMYGITETTVHVTYRPITLADVEGGAGSVIGVPLPDLELHVLDALGEPVPIGVTGELHVGGAGLARGYLNRPELTAERFIRHPFSAVPGARLYRSGDLARRLSTGEREYLGRIDTQVKIRGFRIELGEIEAAIARHPAVRECVVLAREDGPDDKRLVAYVVLDGETSSSVADELRAHAGAHLPDYMVPAHFVTLPALPLTSNGKVDRQALPAPDPGRRETSRPFTAPRTPTEQEMASIWAQVLRVEPVGIDDNFFELGGDSLKAVRVLTAIRASLGVEVPLRHVFERPTVAGLAEMVDLFGVCAQAATASDARHEEVEI